MSIERKSPIEPKEKKEPQKVFPAYAIRVDSQEDNIKAQGYFFELGYFWTGVRKNHPFYTDAKCILANENGWLSYDNEDSPRHYEGVLYISMEQLEELIKAKAVYKEVSKNSFHGNHFREKVIFLIPNQYISHLAQLFLFSLGCTWEEGFVGEYLDIGNCDLIFVDKKGLLTHGFDIDYVEVSSYPKKDVKFLKELVLGMNQEKLTIVGDSLCPLITPPQSNEEVIGEYKLHGSSEEEMEADVKPRYMIDNNEWDSEEIQTLLFSLGYKWHLEGESVIHTNSVRLFACSDGYLAYSDSYYYSGLHEYLTLQELRGLVEKMINGYKIKVSSAKESEEIQQMFFELGYDWFDNKKTIGRVDKPFLLVDGEGVIFFCESLETFEEQQLKEITIPQLCDLVVLHRNDAKDATHKSDFIGNLFFVASDEKAYEFKEGKWQPKICKSLIFPIDQTTPSQEEVKTGMTWQDALRAMADGREVEGFSGEVWINLKKISVASIKKARAFRFAPQTVALEGNFTKEDLLKIAGEMV